MNWLRKYWKRILLIVVLIVAVAVVGFVAWASTPSGETMPTALAALESNDEVTVVDNEWLVFEPADSEPTTGYIFYPGGRVLAQSYAPLGQAIADEGYLVVIVPMPLNLAVLNVNGADAVIAAYPEIKHWAIGGHSLGGSMAARYAYEHPNTVEGLVMMGAFPEAQLDMSDRDLVVASIYGELDGLATVDEVEASAPLLPDDTQFVLIKGANHAQFGWYGPQAGDNEATISREAQYKQVITATTSVLETISQ